MKKQILKFPIVVMLVLILLAKFSACKDDPEPDSPCIAVESLEIDSTTTEMLNDFFNTVALTMKFNNEVEDKRFLINSWEELEDIVWKGYAHFWWAGFENINWEQYTFVAACLFARHGGIGLEKVTLCKNEQEYTLNEVTFFTNGAVTLETYYYYYWQLYPKIESEFTINYVEIEKERK